jgi:hypothetical protein
VTMTSPECGGSKAVEVVGSDGSVVVAIVISAEVSLRYRSPRDPASYLV